MPILHPITAMSRKKKPDLFDFSITIAKGLIMGRMVPADNVRIANNLLRAISGLDGILARQKLRKLITHVTEYGTIVGTAEFDF